VVGTVGSGFDTGTAGAVAAAGEILYYASTDGTCEGENADVPGASR
jgi:hypothetical protein